MDYVPPNIQGSDVSTLDASFPDSLRVVMLGATMPVFSLLTCPSKSFS